MEWLSDPHFQLFERCYWSNIWFSKMELNRIIWLTFFSTWYFFKSWSKIGRHHFRFVYFRLHWVFASAWGLSLVVVASLVIEHNLALGLMGFSNFSALSCPTTFGIFLDRGLNPHPCTGRQILNHWTTRVVQLT